MKQVLCPIVVGRDEERRVLEHALDDACDGSGRAVVLLGDAGIGKSRLTRELVSSAGARNARVLVGRAVDADTPVPFRPLTEAVASAIRSSGPPESPELRPFRSALSRIIPEWREHAAEGDQSSVVLAEAFVRLLRTLAAGYECVVLVVEDLHWADAETLAILEYLVDNVRSESVLILMTSRMEHSAGRLLVNALSRRRAADVIDLAPLSEDDAVRVASACLDVPSVPGDVESLIKRFAEGVPFLIEELLATSHQQISTGVVVPQSFAESVAARVAALPEDAQALVRAAAVVGGRFDAAVLSQTTNVPESRVIAALEETLQTQLIIDESDSIRFRHALTREAVLDDIARPAREALAGRALEAVERCHPELLQGWGEVAADLAEAAGRRERAAELLLEAGRNAITRAGLDSAEQILVRARTLTTEAKLQAEIGSWLVEALSLAGKFDDAFEAGSDVLTDVGLLAPERRFDVHLALARAALAADRWEEAGEQVGRARDLAATPAALAHVDAVAAHVAIGRGEIDDASAFARQAVERAEAAGLGAVACEALEVIGRCARIGDLEAAEAAFEQARSRARARGLQLWEVRALHELGTIDLLRSASSDRLEEARHRALEIGALAIATVVDLQLTAAGLLSDRLDSALEASNRCREMATRMRLHHLVALAASYASQAYALQPQPNRKAMEAAIAEALSIAGDHPEVMAAVISARGCAALVEGDRDRALREFDDHMSYFRRLATTAPAHSRGVWALMRALDDKGAEAAIAEVRESGAIANRANLASLAYAEAVVLGRTSDDGARAAGLVVEGDGYMRHMPFWHQYGRRLVAEAALQDGWGDPIGWLREAEAYFEVAGYDRLASNCRGLLRRAGAPVSQRARGEDVPAELRSMGVTSREAEVLLLLAEGLANKDIAARLYLSPRTVEKHVESLMRKTGIEKRGQLVAFAASRPFAW